MRIRSALVALAVAAAGCAGDEGVADPTGPPTSAATSSTTTEAEDPGTTSSTTSTTIEAFDFIEVTVAAGNWTFREVCAPGEGRGEAVAGALAAADDELRSLVARHVSGWPTTTVAFDVEDIERWEAEAREAAVAALVLADVLGASDELIVSWDEFEQGYSNAELQFPPLDAISIRLTEWRATAQEVRVAVAAECG